MGTTEQILENALIIAQNNGIKIVRGAVFNFCPNKAGSKPSSCNILGAVLFATGKYKEFVGYEFPKDYIANICDYIQADSFYIWKLSKGFDRGIELIIDHSGIISSTEIDKISRFGNALAKKYTKENND